MALSEATPSFSASRLLLKKFIELRPTQCSLCFYYLPHCSAELIQRNIMLEMPARLSLRLQDMIRDLSRAKVRDNLEKKLKVFSF